MHVTNCSQNLRQNVQPQNLTGDDVFSTSLLGKQYKRRRVFSNFPLLSRGVGMIPV